MGYGGPVGPPNAFLAFLLACDSGRDDFNRDFMALRCESTCLDPKTSGCPKATCQDWVANVFAAQNGFASCDFLEKKAVRCIDSFERCAMTEECWDAYECHTAAAAAAWVDVVPQIYEYYGWPDTGDTGESCNVP